MPGSITYNGIPVENGGQIFDGLKFWVARRVPTRATILEHIERNSGVVVLLEKDADYLIADHARKDAPSGSISWKFITESVENGVAQLPDRYRIGHAPAGPREVSSSRPTKGERTPFSAADDAALASWVLSHNNHLTGNDMYKLFEATHPNHPWQSWRNRFVKKLILLPLESLQQLAAQATDRPQPLAIEGGSADQELPDPTELMLQRKGHKIQRENALQRANNRATRASTAATTAQRVAAAPSPQPQTAEQAEIAMTEAKNQFYEDLQVFCEETGVEIAPMQLVAGQPLELWDLSRAVSDEHQAPEGINWLRVAHMLGYGWLDPATAADALQQCYEENLAEFLAVMQDTFGDEGQGGQEEQEEDKEDDDDDASPEPAVPASEPDPPLPSSPPEHFLTKRPRNDDGELNIPTPVKRRRLHIPPEIPSTPEVNRHQPTRGGTASKVTPTPLRRRESSMDMTPSQQLRSELSEHVQISPIPLRANKAARNRQIGSSEVGKPSGSGTGIKRRSLPQTFKPQTTAPPAPAIPEDFSFPRALPRTQPPPAPTSRRPAQAIPRRLSRERELSELIQHYESLGYAHKVVVEGLRRTTMTPGLATVVMQSLRDGRGVPTHHEGVWTDRDDTALRLVVAAGGSVNLDDEDSSSSKEALKERRKARRARDRLLDKHGQEGMALRIKYLRASDGLAAAAGTTTAANEQSR